jgi:hypothetical protein
VSALDIHPRPPFSGPTATSQPTKQLRASDIAGEGEGEKLNDFNKDEC